MLQQGRSSSTPSSTEGHTEGQDYEEETPQTSTIRSLPNGQSCLTDVQGMNPNGQPLHHNVQHQRQESEPTAQQYNYGSIATDSHSVLPDVVDRGILSMSKATELFKRYLKELVPQFPAVVFPSGCTAGELRKTEPVLFLAVLAASAGTSDPALNLKLNQEIQQVYATRIIIKGHKDIELVKSLLISITYTYPPEK